MWIFKRGPVLVINFSFFFLSYTSTDAGTTWKANRKRDR